MCRLLVVGPGRAAFRAWRNARRIRPGSHPASRSPREKLFAWNQTLRAASAQPQTWRAPAFPVSDGALAKRVRGLKESDRSEMASGRREEAMQGELGTPSSKPASEEKKRRPRSQLRIPTERERSEPRASGQTETWQIKANDRSRRRNPAAVRYSSG